MNTPSPFPTDTGGLVPIDAGLDEPLTPERVRQSCQDGDGRFFVRLTSGHEHRGGYLFHVRLPEDGGELQLLTWQGTQVATFPSWEELTALINHVSGRRYDVRMAVLSADATLRLKEAGPPPASEAG